MPREKISCIGKEWSGGIKDGQEASSGWLNDGPVLFQPATLC